MVYEELRKTAANSCHLFLDFLAEHPQPLTITKKTRIFFEFSRTGVVKNREGGRNAFVAG
jgi:hypothetical protein